MGHELKPQAPAAPEAAAAPTAVAAPAAAAAPSAVAAVAAPPAAAAPAAAAARSRLAGSEGGSATRLSAHLLCLFEELECDPASCRISAEELRCGLERLGLPCSPTLVDEIFAAADKNADGHVNYGKLLQYATAREAEVARTFARIAHNGRIRPDEMRGALQEMGLHVSDEQAAGFFQALDRERTGRVTLSEFERFCWLLPKVNVRDHKHSRSPT